MSRIVWPHAFGTRFDIQGFVPSFKWRLLVQWTQCDQKSIKVYYFQRHRHGFFFHWHHNLKSPHNTPGKTLNKLSVYLLSFSLSLVAVHYTSCPSVVISWGSVSSQSPFSLFFVLWCLLLNNWTCFTLKNKNVNQENVYFW